MTAFAAFYRLLLLAYPREFRAEHGADASNLFAEACGHDWKTTGFRAVSRRVMKALIEVPRAGFAERSAHWRPAGAAALWQGLGGDFRQAARSFRSRPALTLTIVFTLAVGLGTNVAVFSVIDATLLRRLPFVHASRVVDLEAAAGTVSGRAGAPRPSWARKWTAGIRALERVEWRVSRSALVTGLGAATRVRVMDVSGGYLDAISARPIIGRLLGRADTAASAARVVVLSPRFWRQRFGEKSGVLGTSINIDGIRHTVVGVADLESDVAGLTFSLATALHDDDDRELAGTVAWLRPGASIEAAQAELDAAPPIVEEARTFHPRLARPRNTFWDIPVFRATELGLMAAALLILAVAGVNVSHLLLAAGQERVSELAVRRALGASAVRLARLLFVETMVLALAGSAAGLFIAWALVKALTSLDAGPQLQTRIESIRLDPVIAAYAVAVGCFVAVVFGLWPAVRSSRTRALAVNATANRTSRRRRLSSSVLVAAETGLSAAVLVVAGVVGHVFLSMQFAPRGFDADRILRARVILPADRYPTPGSRAAFFDRLRAASASLPGVEGFGLGYEAAGPSDFFTSAVVTVAGAKTGPVEMTTGYGFVAPGFFSLTGIPLLQGADFSPADLAASRAADAVQPTVISRSLAHRFWPNGDAVGAVFELAEPQRVRRFRVLGIAGDVSQWGLFAHACTDCDPVLYLPLPDQRRYTHVLLRLRPGVTPPVAAVQAAIAQLDPDVPADDELETSAASMNGFIRQQRFTAALFAAFALVALTLLAVGLSAVVSRAVAQRTREMGIRLALGATRGSVRSLVVMDGMRPALFGLAGGVIAALGVTRAIRSILYGLSPADPVTLIFAPALVVGIVLGALALPAVRATRVDPARTLRAD